MAIKRQKSVELGFGKSEGKQQRAINKNGSYNYLRLGLPFSEQFNFYHFLINLSPAWFISIILFWYTAINLIFTVLYYMCGTGSLTGMNMDSPFKIFWEIYFFSAQTLTTVGYGRINPLGFSANFVSSIEAMVGLMSFALITGLLYGRFSKPNPKIRFSHNALISPYQDGRAFMFRIANFMNSNMMNVKVRLSVSLIDQSGERNFYTLTMERDEIMFFPSSWTIVHAIDENSPLFGLKEAALRQSSPEFFALVQGFDDTFDQTLNARASYIHEDVIWGGKFVKIGGVTESGKNYVDLGKLDVFDLVDLPDVEAPVVELVKEQ